MAVNLRYFFAPCDADNETTAREEIEYRLWMFHHNNERLLFSGIFNTWCCLETLFRYYYDQNLNEASEHKHYEKGSRIFSKYVGFSRIIEVHDYAGGRHKVTLARVVYPPSGRAILDY